MEQIKILVFGGGNIGLRYVQAIAKTNLSVNLIVVETNSANQEKIKNEWKKIQNYSKNKKLTVINSIKSNINELSLAIISTGAANRLDAVNDLLKKSNPKYLILEKLLAQSSQDLEKLSKVVAGITKIWVSTPRRAMKWFKDLKNEIFKFTPVNIYLRGGYWELASCAIHYIDLASFWTGEAVKSIEISDSKTKWINSKRLGYFEFLGKLVVNYSNGSILKLNSRYEGIKEDFLLVKLSNKKKWLINEQKGIAISSEKKNIIGSMENLSVQYTKIIEDIIMTGNCELPKLDVSIIQHHFFLNCMLKNWNKVNNLKDSRVLIT